MVDGNCFMDAILQCTTWLRNNNKNKTSMLKMFEVTFIKEQESGRNTRWSQ